MRLTIELERLVQQAAARADFHKFGRANFEKNSETELKALLEPDKLFFISSVAGLQAISRLIENLTFSLTTSTFRLYSSFQEPEHFRPQEKRYRQMVALGQPVYLIFGRDEPKLSWSAPNLKIVSCNSATTTAPAIHDFWLVVLDNPQTVSMAMVAKELPALPRPQGASQNLQLYRQFQGFWTYDHKITADFIKELEAFVGQTFL
jgi:hypothetical protein